MKLLHCFYRNFATRSLFVYIENQKAPEIEPAEGAGKREYVTFTSEESGEIVVKRGERTLGRVETAEESDMRKALYTGDYVKRTSRTPDNFVAALRQVDPGIPEFDFDKDNTHLVGAVERVQAAINAERRKMRLLPIAEDGAFGKITVGALQEAFPDACTLS